MNIFLCMTLFHIFVIMSYNCNHHKGKEDTTMKINVVTERSPKSDVENKFHHEKVAT